MATKEREEGNEKGKRYKSEKKTEDGIQWVGEIRKYEDGTIEETAETTIRGRELYIGARIDSSRLVGVIYATIIQRDKKGKECNLEYYWRRKILGFGDALEERLSKIVTAKVYEMERFVKLAL